MATIINNPDRGRIDDTNGTGVVLGVIIAIILVLALLLFGLPYLRGRSTAPAANPATNTPSFQIEGGVSGGANVSPGQ